MSTENVFCLDPSCFTTLQHLDDSLKTLEAITKKESHCKLYVPSYIYDTIILPPEQKFIKLPQVIKSWFVSHPKNDIRGMTKNQKNDYVLIMRKIFKKFSPIPTKSITDNITKLGNKSIHQKEVIEKFGKIKGKILFEMMVVSSTIQAKIIAFGQKTASLIGKLHITIIRSPSRIKHEIKTGKKIRSSLMILLFSMSLTSVQDFIDTYQFESFPFLLTESIALGSFGVLMIGNG